MEKKLSIESEVNRPELNLTDVDEIRKAIITAEILNRKY